MVCCVLCCAVLQVLMSGGKDLISAPKDIAEQAKRLVNAPLTQIHYKDYAHMDFVSGQAGFKLCTFGLWAGSCKTDAGACLA
jgi:hypothetical protein